MHDLMKADCKHSHDHNELIRHRIVESMDWDDVDFAAGDPPYNLSVCTVMTSDWYIDARSNRTVSGAADRVVEWIEFHLEVGFEHFVIFDNSHSRCGERPKQCPFHFTFC